MIKIEGQRYLDERFIKFDFVQGSGPGGQNINKVATTAQLRFDLAACDCLAPAVKVRLEKIAKGRLSNDGVLIIEAKRYRSQEKNKLDAIDRLIDLIKKALVEPKSRIKRKPSLRAAQRRMEGKKKRGAQKKLRGPVKPSG